MFKIAAFLTLALLMTGCANSSMPRGAVAGCGEFTYMGTWTKSQTDMKALWLSNADAVSRLTVEDVIALANAMGCNAE